MKAILLAGGKGTRLRPLTHTTPKPVMPLAGRPFLSFMLDWAHSHGVDELILSCGFMSDAVERVLKATGRIDLVHANSSRDAAGSGADRHENFAAGTIDVESLRSAEQISPPRITCKPV